MAKITKEELEELKSGLITEPYVLEYRGDDYVFTTLTKVGLKNMRKLQENKILKEEDKETQIIELFFSHCIWPEKSVVDAIRETDSLFEPYIVKQFNLDELFTPFENSFNSIQQIFSTQISINQLFGEILKPNPILDLSKKLQTNLSQLKVMIDLPRVELGKALQTGLSEKLKVMLKLPRLY